MRQPVLVPVQFVYKKFVRCIYSMYLSGASIEVIVSALALKGYDVYESEVNDIIDQMNDIYL